MLISNGKTILRWVCITLVFISYYLWIGIASLSFGHIDEKESMMFSGDTVTAEYHRAIIDSVYQATNTVFEVAILGFPIGVVLILIIFKKVR
ncbi:hypothetical protein ACRN96_18145 [Shewanella oncorhynchi]|jgi:hypothetical protein|uniref:hypothetical protein n=1 Tax=Shewanella oncorhynchi TaxID=2726434 RepID=UPI003D78BF54